MSVFQADVPRGSLWHADPDLFGPRSNHLGRAAGKRVARQPCVVHSFVFYVVNSFVFVTIIRRTGFFFVVVVVAVRENVGCRWR